MIMMLLLSAYKGATAVFSSEGNSEGKHIASFRTWVTGNAEPALRTAIEEHLKKAQYLERTLGDAETDILEY